MRPAPVAARACAQGSAAEPWWVRGALVGAWGPCWGCAGVPAARMPCVCRQRRMGAAPPAHRMRAVQGAHARAAPTRPWRSLGEACMPARRHASVAGPPWHTGKGAARDSTRPVHPAALRWQHKRAGTLSSHSAPSSIRMPSAVVRLACLPVRRWASRGLLPALLHALSAACAGQRKTSLWPVRRASAGLMVLPCSTLCERSS